MLVYAGFIHVVVHLGVTIRRSFIRALPAGADPLWLGQGVEMAIIEPKMFLLKDGAELAVRVGELRDAPQLLENGKHFILDGDGQVLVPGELNPTPEEEIKWVENHRNKATNLLIVAELNGNLVGHLDFYGNSRQRIRHTGHFGMGVRAEHRGKGIGKALLTRLIDWAKGAPELEKINLDVLSNNARAIALYRSLGFEECGKQRNEIKLTDRQYLDNIKMELLLDRSNT